jgi:hypothetical protein
MGDSELLNGKGLDRLTYCTSDARSSGFPFAPALRSKGLAHQDSLKIIVLTVEGTHEGHPYR